MKSGFKGFGAGGGGSGNDVNIIEQNRNTHW